MLADFFTKPIQGELFRFFRNIIMGYVSAIDVINVNDEMKERVKKWQKYQNIIIPYLSNDVNKGEKSPIINKIPDSTHDEIVSDISSDNKKDKDIIKNPEQPMKRKRTKRTYDLNKVTGHVHICADVTVGSGKIG